MLCELKRIQIDEAIDNGEKLSQNLKKHLSRCRECRKYYNRRLKLDSLLTAGAAEMKEPGSQVDLRIAAAVKGKLRNVKRENHVGNGRILRFAAAAALLIGVGTMALLSHHSSKVQTREDIRNAISIGESLLAMSSTEKTEEPVGAMSTLTSLQQVSDAGSDVAAFGRFIDGIVPLMGSTPKE